VNGYRFTPISYKDDKFIVAQALQKRKVFEEADLCKYLDQFA